MAADSLEQAARSKRPVDKNRQASFRGEREKPALGGSLGDGVIELHEVQFLGVNHFRKIIVGALGVMGYHDIANFPLFFPAPQGREMGAVIDQVVNLHEIDARSPQLRQRLLHLPDALLAPGSPNLRCEKEFLVHVQLRGEIADDGFGPAIHRR